MSRQPVTSARITHITDGKGTQYVDLETQDPAGVHKEPLGIIETDGSYCPRNLPQLVAAIAVICDEVHPIVVEAFGLHAKK